MSTWPFFMKKMHLFACLKKGTAYNAHPLTGQTPQGFSNSQRGEKLLTK